MDDCSSKLYICYFVLNTVLTYCESNCDQEKIFGFEVEGQELILKTDLFKQGMVRVIFETEYYLLGGAEVKTGCCTKLSKLRKTSAISSIFNKKELLKDLTK